MCPWFPSKRWTLLVKGGMGKLTMFITGVIGSLAALTAQFTLYHVMRYCTVYIVPCEEVLTKLC